MKLLFQPTEEAGVGASAAVKGRLLKNNKTDEKPQRIEEVLDSGFRSTSS
ncbi:hypothetical protein KFK09_000776 [Dendrobium nobile]|uniref:Uncharacterized protein n=1 Tax=Dendrobium nobile TaxID=94219 RepID=A0A8T3CFQ7_DENNO|nr:hypothetical protein KFK09_000776 [Dendrobium nobile]